MRKILLIAIFCLAGCESMGGKPNGYEYAWHAMNIVDMGQTIHVAREPGCYREADWLTKRIIGEHRSSIGLNIE